MNETKTYDVKAIYPTFKGARRPQPGEIWASPGGQHMLCRHFEEATGDAAWMPVGTRGSLVARGYSIWQRWSPPPIELPSEMPPFFVYKWLAQRVPGIPSRDQLNPRMARINPMRLSNGYSTSLPGDMFIVVFTDQRPARWMTRAQLIDLIDDETEDDD